MARDGPLPGLGSSEDAGAVFDQSESLLGITATGCGLPQHGKQVKIVLFCT